MLSLDEFDNKKVKVKELFDKAKLTDDINSKFEIATHFYKGSAGFPTNINEAKIYAIKAFITLREEWDKANSAGEPPIQYEREFHPIYRKVAGLLITLGFNLDENYFQTGRPYKTIEILKAQLYSLELTREVSSFEKMLYPDSLLYNCLAVVFWDKNRFGEKIKTLPLDLQEHLTTSLPT